ncbi:uncharacterized protein LOC114963177 [Acropora millepora]|uniref:uncharacterized protein LOC114963177 n=1 Tax=Acropora millepora TaxID=45264 RepID=UPI001CF4FE15|nr:uncharacterized protein LOC114963177 [Acropora millepora]
MDEELGSFLDKNFKELQPTFEQHKVYSISALKMISDAQFEKMGLAIGQVAMMKALLAAEDKEGEEAKEQNKERIRTLVDKIRKKRGRPRETKTPVCSGSNREKTTLKKAAQDVHWLTPPVL